MSNPVLDAISERRSIRAYLPDQITIEQLDALLKAAKEAPSARNLQPWHISVVQNPDITKKINDAAVKELSAGGGVYSDVKDIFYSAPTVFFFSGDDSNAWSKLDCGIAVQTVALAAQSLGLGSVILGLPAIAFGGSEAEELKALLKIPEGFSVVIAIAIGKAAATKEAHPIREGLVTIVS